MFSKIMYFIRCHFGIYVVKQENWSGFTAAYQCCTMRGVRHLVKGILDHHNSMCVIGRPPRVTVMKRGKALPWDPSWYDWDNAPTFDDGPA